MTPSKLNREKKKCQQSFSYGSEEGCDVVFLVGTEEDRCRLPAHKDVLRSKNVVFRAMFSENYVCTLECPQIVPDVEARAFDKLLRFYYGEDVDLQTWLTALQTLYPAHKYQCPDLVKQCVDFLSDRIDSSNVLFILTNVQLLCVDYENLENVSRENKLNSQGPGGNKVTKKLTASDVQNSENEQSENLNSIEKLCATLLQKCLSFVDREAEIILRSDELEDLNLATIHLILSRDTLDIPDELMVFIALHKWADKECKRKQLPLTAVSKREVLGEALFLPRYLTMSRSSFEKPEGPAKSSLFTPEEITTLSKIISGANYEITPNSSVSNSPVHQANNPYNKLVVHPPAILCPYIRTMRKRRCPVGQPTLNNKSPKKRFSFLEKLKSKKGCCCKKTTSQNSTPANSNQSSPVHNVNQSQNQSHRVSSRGNTVIEHIFICLACIFD